MQNKYREPDEDKRLLGTESLAELAGVARIATPEEWRDMKDVLEKTEVDSHRGQKEKQAAVRKRKMTGAVCVTSMVGVIITLGLSIQYYSSMSTQTLGRVNQGLLAFCALALVSGLAYGWQEIKIKQRNRSSVPPPGGPANDM